MYSFLRERNRAVTSYYFQDSIDSKAAQVNFKKMLMYIIFFIKS